MNAANGIFIKVKPVFRLPNPFRVVCTFYAAAACLFLPFSAPAATVPAADVWRKAEELGRKEDIDPLLIYSIAWAESSLDDRADSGQARGLMQVSHVAWTETTKRSYDDAWKWQTNMEVAVKYLHALRKRLENSGRYSWPVLVAAYHYGPRRVADARYNIARLPEQRNRIYKALLAGRVPELPGVAPFRAIDEPSAIRAFATLEPAYHLVLPVLDVAEYDEIPDEVPDVLEIVPLTPFRDGAEIWKKDDSGDEVQADMLGPVFIGVPFLDEALAKVPEVVGLFIPKAPALLADGLAPAAAAAASGPKSAPVSDAAAAEIPPELEVVDEAPLRLDTTLGGLVETPLATATTLRMDEEGHLIEELPPLVIVEPSLLDASPKSIVKPDAAEVPGRLAIPKLVQ